MENLTRLFYAARSRKALPNAWIAVAGRRSARLVTAICFCRATSILRRGKRLIWLFRSVRLTGASCLRAILLASATRTSIGGLRLSIRSSHDPAIAPLRPAQEATTLAPMISKRRSVRQSCRTNVRSTDQGHRPSAGAIHAPGMCKLHRKFGLSATIMKML
jgi:hypothetical protein